MDTDAAQRSQRGKVADTSADALEGDGSEFPANLSAEGPNEPGTGSGVAGGGRALVSEGVSTNGDENAAPPDTLGRVVSGSPNAIDPAQAPLSTRVFELDSDELSDRDLETLTASTDVGGDGAAARSVPGRRLAFPALQLDERLGRVLLALVLSVLLWLYVLSLGNPINTTGYARLPMDVRNTAPQLKLINNLPEVDATVQGPQNVLATLARSDIRPYVDLSGIPQGVHDVPVRADVDPSKKNDLTITLSPNKVQVQLELQVTRVFSVSAQVNGTPAIGYKPEAAHVTPDRVNVTGSQDAVQRVAMVVVPVDIEGKAGTQQGSKTPVALDAKGQEVTGLAYDPPTVQVEVPMQLLLNYRAVGVRVPILGPPAAGYTVESVVITPTNVTVCCSPSQIELIDFLETQPVAITNTASSVITATSLILPPGVQLYSDQPGRINVAINVAPIQSSVRLPVAPTIEGLGPGYSATVAPGQVDVTLSGTFNQLQALSPTSIRAVVNADGRTPGTYTVTPKVTVPQGVTLKSSSPEQVTLTIIAPTPVPTETPAPQPTPVATATRAPEAPATPTPSPARPTPTPTPQPAPSATPTQPLTPQPSPTHTPTPGT